MGSWRECVRGVKSCAYAFFEASKQASQAKRVKKPSLGPRTVQLWLLRLDVASQERGIEVPSHRPPLAGSLLCRISVGKLKKKSTEQNYGEVARHGIERKKEIGHEKLCQYQVRPSASPAPVVVVLPDRCPEISATRDASVVIIANGMKTGAL